MTSLRSHVPAKLHHSCHDPSLHKFVCLTIAASDLQDLLTAQKVTSVLRVERYIEHISDHNDYLRQAKSPGTDRWEGRTRGPLHGIPVLIVDNIANSADLGMDTTAGCLAPVGSRRGKSAELVNQLTAGLIILGKRQMTEFAGFKGLNTISVPPSVVSQAQSAYTRGDVDPSDDLIGISSPSGSSTSSAASLSAGFVPVALGTEVLGYLITPVTGASLFGCRPKINVMPQSSVFPLSQHCDTVGPMAKIVVEFANLLDVLENPKYLQNQRSYLGAFPGDFRELRIRTTAPQLSCRPNALALDPLTLTASDLQDLLQTGKITSVEIVKMYLDQIQKHNLKGMGIRAIISTLPREKAIAFAQELDDERATKGARGPMHGIPILVKDSILTPSLGMDTTCGSYALKGMKGREDAKVIKGLLKAGMIILGKTNLTEWGNFKETFMTAGWSALGGQTQSPYVRGGVLPGAKFISHSTPGGSSSGSGAGVAAGFSPVSIGTESDGSVVQPATRAALYGLKATVGSIDDTGVQGVGPSFMSLGGLAKSPRDLANVMSILMGGVDFSSFLKPNWQGLRIGFVDPELWQLAPFVVEPNEGFRKQSTAAMKKAMAKMKANGAKTEYPVPLITLAEITSDPTGVKEMEDLVSRDVGPAMEKFLALLENPPVKNVRDIIEFNRKHANLELPPEHPGQQVLEDAIKSEAMTDEEYNHGLKLLRGTAISGIKKTFKDFGVDVIMGPADARFASVAACAGFPVASVPLGFADFNGRAFGMSIIAGAGGESDILRVMSAWEVTFPEGRQPPPMLVNWQAAANVARSSSF